MSLIILSTLLSILMAYLFWGQSIMLGYRATAPFLAIIFYFYLLKVKPPLHMIEKFIWCFAFIYIILWIYGVNKAPEIVFGDPDDYIGDARGIYRLTIPGKCILVLAFFLALNKYGITRKKVFLFLFAGLFIIIVLQVVRQIIFCTLLIGIYYLLKNNKRVWLYTFIIAVSLIALGDNIKISEESVIGNLLSLTESQIEYQQHGEEDIRIKEYVFFFTDFSKNFFTDLFGNGVPHSESKLGYFYYYTVQERYHYYLSDVGYAQMFVVTGALGLILYLYLFGKILMQKVPSHIIFAKLFIIYQIFANIAASWYTHDIICICICIYVLSIYSERKKEKRIIPGKI
ncbi:MAG: hypothetical protein LUG18_12340 [Candidatus Azobacteroides sp.]|nr:hypothetical protein [Candidatus Azobacteroides sp.]